MKLSRIEIIIIISLIIVVSIVSRSETQQTYNPGQQFTWGTELSTTCTTGGIYIVISGATRGMYFCDSTNAWISISSSNPIPSGVIIISLTTCSSGWTEVTSLNGRMLRGTLAANGDVETTSGSDSITPTGTNSTGTVTPLGTIAWPVGVPTFAGSSSTVVVNHLHTLATGTNATGSFSQVIGTIDTSSGLTGGTPTQTALGTLSGNPTAGGAANYTPVGTISWPAGVPTLTGSSSVTSAETFTGVAFNNRPAYTNVIFCQKN